MKRILILSLLLYSCGVSNYLLAKEISDITWSENLLTITYGPTKGVVSCTAYNSEGKGVGGSASMSVGGVATVTIEVPQEYAGKELRIDCSSPSSGY